MVVNAEKKKSRGGMKQGILTFMGTWFKVGDAGNPTVRVRSRLFSSGDSPTSRENSRCRASEVQAAYHLVLWELLEPTAFTMRKWEVLGRIYK